MKKLFSIFLIAGLLFPAFVLAYDFGYVRTPSGFEITSPVSFWVQYDEDWWNNYPDPEESCGGSEVNVWRVVVYGYDLISEDEFSFESEWASSSSNPFTFEIELPVNEFLPYYDLIYQGVKMECEFKNSYILEENGEIFRIVESEEPEPGIFGFPSDFASLSVGFLDEFISDVAMPLTLIFGILLALWLIDYLLGLVIKRKKS